MTNHDTTIEAMLPDEVIERLGLRGRDTVLQVTRLCDEINRLLAAVRAGSPEDWRERAMRAVVVAYNDGGNPGVTLVETKERAARILDAEPEGEGGSDDA